LRADVLETERLVLRPVLATDAAEAVEVFGDPALHTFTGGKPATLETLRKRYAGWESPRSPDGVSAWLNWTVRLRETGRIVATVQATVDLQAAAPAAELAWVTAVDQQGQGIATEAAAAVAGWLHEQPGVSALQAYIHPAHVASQHVARSLGMLPQPGRSKDGEQLWSCRTNDDARSSSA
jgi:RimJ/RimL family protein N-acetyltransferase